MVAAGSIQPHAQPQCGWRSQSRRVTSRAEVTVTVADRSAGASPSSRRTTSPTAQATPSSSRHGSHAPPGACGSSSSWCSTVARRASRSSRCASTQRRHADRPGSTNGPIRTAVGSTASHRWATSSRTSRSEVRRRGSPSVTTSVVAGSGASQPDPGHRAGAGDGLPQQDVGLEGGGRAALGPLGGATARICRVDDPALGDQVLEQRHQVRWRRAVQLGQRAVEPRPVGQHEAIGRVETDL